MTGSQFFLQAWSFNPAVIIGCAALLLGYLWAVRFRMNSKTAIFTSGVVLLLVDLIGPMDFLGENYLFSAHMVEHILLELAVPPVLIFGVPPELVQSLLSHNFAAKAERFLRRPVVALPMAVAVMWVWHLPVLYNSALNNDAIHAAQHLSMLVTATIFWWPVFTPLPTHRLKPMSGTVYILLAMLSNMVLGILLTYSPLGYYPKFMRPTDGDRFFQFVRTVWALDPRADLNLGGMVMWIIGGLFYFTALLIVISRLYQPEKRAAEEEGEVQIEDEGTKGPAQEYKHKGSEKWNAPKPESIPVPTYWPFILSAGATIMGLGLLTSVIIVIAGITIFIIAGAKWAGELYRGHEKRE